MHRSLREFLAHARTDAALQERLRVALESPEASHAVVQVAHSAGWLLQAESVQAELAGLLGDRDLDGVVGGSGWGTGEWFAEGYAAKPKIRGIG